MMRDGKDAHWPVISGVHIDMQFVYVPFLQNLDTRSLHQPPDVVQEMRRCINGLLLGST